MKDSMGEQSDSLSSAATASFGLVLAENEAHAGDFAWQDITGELYQFPNNYRNIVRPGRPFIYYAGTRQADGGRRPAYYFGTGFIGDVYPDPTTEGLASSKRKWLAKISDYIPFTANVHLRSGSGNYIETDTSTVVRNHWGVGVRPISRSQFNAIVSLGGVSAVSEALELTGEVETGVSLVEATGTGLLLKRTQRALPGDGSSGRGLGGARRLSRQAKVTGDAAERLFLNFLREGESNPMLREQIVWVARDGATPGYDIEDRRDSANIVAYEVKGTTGERFLSFDLTSNELRAAKLLQERYVLILVTECLGRKPQFQRIANPAALLESGSLLATPSVFNIELHASSPSR